MVHEGVTWFGDQGDAGYDAVVEVGAAAPVAPRLAAVPAPPAAVAPLEKATRRMLWGAAVLAWRDHPLLGLGPDNFRRAYNRYLGVREPDQRLHAHHLHPDELPHPRAV